MRIEGGVMRNTARHPTTHLMHRGVLVAQRLGWGWRWVVVVVAVVEVMVGSGRGGRNEVLSKVRPSVRLL